MDDYIMHKLGFLAGKLKASNDYKCIEISNIINRIIYDEVYIQEIDKHVDNLFKNGVPTI